MHTVDLLEQAISAAQALGYEVRLEWLGGAAGGACEFGGKRWVFIDLALSADEQLEQVIEALQQDARAASLDLSRPLRGALNVRKAA
jgi:hypothetical protein